MKTYNKRNVPLAKALRKRMTKEERKLWYEFLRSYPLRIQRQKPIGEYIADFYCAAAKVVIELDGNMHRRESEMEKDAVRSDFLEELGIAVLRISNLDLRLNFAGVCKQIDTFIKNRLSVSEATDCFE